VTARVTAEVRTVTATRYVAPLRQGGSLPGIVEADDDGLYVLKFRGAGQGVRALVAELVAGEVARTLSLLVPEIVYVELDPLLGRSEPDDEIRALIKNSAGLNLGLDFLPGALGFNPAVDRLDASLAAAIVWLDAFLTNVDRTAKNPNLLIWHRRLWLIDHGAALYVHHAGAPYLRRARDRFPAIRDHVLLPFTTGDALREVDASSIDILTPEVVRGIVDLIPDHWLEDPQLAEPAAHRAAYLEYLLARLEAPRAFLEAALDAQAAHV
jgi:hypothetical protein